MKKIFLAIPALFVGVVLGAILAISAYMPDLSDIKIDEDITDK